MTELERQRSKVASDRFRPVDRGNEIRANLEAIANSAPKLKAKLIAQFKELDGKSAAMVVKLTKLSESQARLKVELSELVESLRFQSLVRRK